MLIPIVLQTQPLSGLVERLRTLGRDAGTGALDVVIAVAVVCLAWAVAALVARLLRGTLRAFRFNDGMRRLVGARAAERHEPAAVAAWAAYWLILAAGALLALELMGFNLAASVGDRLGQAVPAIVASAVLFVGGVLVALFVGAVTRRFLESAGLRAAKLIGQVVGAVLIGFSALLALEQLGFAAQFVMAVGVTATAAVGLGLALAFGLGCRDLARDFLVEYLRSLDDEGPKRPL